MGGLRNGPKEAYVIFEWSLTTNLRIFQEIELVYLFLCTIIVKNNIFFFVGKIHRFVVTEFVKLCDEFDNCLENIINHEIKRVRKNQNQ